jgi:hypothetical protein
MVCPKSERIRILNDFSFIRNIKMINGYSFCGATVLPRYAVRGTLAFMSAIKPILCAGEGRGWGLTYQNRFK